MVLNSLSILLIPSNEDEHTNDNHITNAILVELLPSIQASNGWVLVTNGSIPMVTHWLDYLISQL